ncbi:decaprenyl-phosphate phosphoribosyltransferase [Aeromicrobium sp. A1-2]|uniref:decaprenyl-phosphate phosphoribosyltransferase n=1 Tax=Aeromicrobium sp. A1-2 TaxID=2107713 RepID=UPI000E4930DC|nr:decaprenyl-phosphate phosphoribosyltransferase [Aeromicrobium sp. A1-2]AXT84785.1 decaprenyl-phosphate phosphoribosyltransferase [Aeromicrobium sp. A1-2]
MSSLARTAYAVLRTTRPRQWTKNVLVIAAPLAAGVVWDGSTILAVLGTFVAFTLAASSIYLFNDVIDAEDDRRHPRKRLRPVAAGQLTPAVAIFASAVCAGLALSLGWLIDPDLAATLAVYVVIQVLYALWLKEQPVIDLSIVAAGFLLRAIAGGVAVDVPLSQWFLLVASFGSLFMVAGKRYSELRSVGAAARTRRTLEVYSESYLRFVWSLAAAITITAYSLWAFEISDGSGINWQAVSIAPFVMGLLRYAVDVDRGLAGEPEEAVLRDPVLQIIGLLWLTIFAIGVYSS